MKIALFGYGKMGKTIERIAVKRGHEIVAVIDVDTKGYDITMADVAIDFSTPNAAFNNINKCFNKNIPIISGTTGWLDRFDIAIENCNKRNGAFIYASNFSLGVNLFFELNTQLAKMMRKFKAYNITLEEIHHTQKLDAPSGTAITLAKNIIENSDKKKWSLTVTDTKKEIPIVSKRIKNVPGTHTVKYSSDVDEIEIKHTAKNRDGFALGAVIAAEWLQGKKGVYTMKDVLGINQEFE
ncbi:MAG: 4-hydroxy-tetrahydrodipicolinate reductase [Flavobacteriaceae bacterium]|nr:4-hydroxy-tetrahydrodipicolinate reductase [Flavobacteriaceae bacterium]